MDREKVIKGLECCCATKMNRCEQNTCPYWVSEICCIDEMMADALALLKELIDERHYYEEWKEGYGKQEIVRCKDCKHAVAQDCEQVWCSFVDDGLAHNPDWFCADGEHK